MSTVSNVNNVNNNYVAQTQTAASNTAATTTANSENQDKTVVAEDEYAGSVEQIKTGNYSKNAIKPDYDKINELKADLKNNVGAFKAMVEGMNRSDGTSNASGVFGFDTNDDSSWSKWVQDVVSGQYKVSASEQAEAQAAVAEDGYWGVEQTSQRIVDFAKSISGGDIDQYDKLLGAIEKGFGAAKDAWGRDMPTITQETYEKTMEKMQAWKDEMTGTTTQNAVKAAQGVTAD